MKNVMKTMEMIVMLLLDAINQAVYLVVIIVKNVKEMVKPV